MTPLVTQKQEVANMQPHFDQNQIDILRNSICKGCNEDEFKVFLMACQKTQLDPFMKQIYAVKRGNAMTIQTGIDGYRLIAERGGHYAPGPESTYTYDKDGRLVSATAYIKKQTRDGQWHTISASAFYDEYCQSFNGKPSGLWQKMPRTMLAKCAESLALRKAFPAEMSGLYTQEEMAQADVGAVDITTPSVNFVPPLRECINLEQTNELLDILSSSPEAKKKIWALMKANKWFKLQDIEASQFESVKKMALEIIQLEIAEKEAAKEAEEIHDDEA